MKIAIKGHPTRGKEVIKILESLGGKNNALFIGVSDFWYFIDSNGHIRNEYQNILIKAGFKTYTLEKFEKEFPFKIGDRIVSLTTGLIGTITKFSENGVYHFKYDNGICSLAYAKYLKLYKEMKEERNITLTLEKAKEWYKKGGELREIALQAFTEKELTKIDLPKTWEEFCKNYPVQEGECWLSDGDEIMQHSYSIDRLCKNWIPSKKSAEAHLAMIQLEQLRDCYRGLFVTVIGMPVWCIKRQNGELIICQRKWGRDETFLSFQSLEVAKEYLDNFEPLIKQAGDLI